MKRLLAVLLSLLLPVLVMAEGVPDEIAAARSLGLVSDAMDSAGDASWYDLYDLLDNAIFVKTGRRDMSWGAVKTFSLADYAMSRGDAARVLYLGALRMGYDVNAMPGDTPADKANAAFSTNGFENARYEDIASAGEQKRVSETFDSGLGEDAARTTDLITFCIRQEDCISHLKVMEVSTDGFRPLEALSREEAIFAVYRLFNSFQDPVADLPHEGDSGD